MTWIKVLAPSRHERGQAFERFVRQVLDSCGLSQFRTRLKVTGAGPLIDIAARYRKDATPALGVCRAFSREVTADEVKSFFRRYRRERRRNRRLRGLFLSCTPFSPKVFAWYQTLDSEVQQAFQLLGPDAIVARLAQSHRLLDPKAVDAEVSASSTYPPGSRSIALLGGKLYWIQTLLVNRRPKAFCVLEGLGGWHPVPSARRSRA